MALILRDFTKRFDGLRLLACNFQQIKSKKIPQKKQNKDKFFEYIFNDSDKISGVFGQQPPVMRKREELKINEAREEWEKLLTQRWRQTKEIW